MNSRTFFAASIAIALIVGAAIGMWYTLRARPPAFCEISGRVIHANMRTVAEVGGKRLHACCARCALTLGSQTGKPVRILKVTDYMSGGPVDASKAYFVDGSQVEVCSMPRVKVNEQHLPYERVFDRCAPSLIAFAREEEAKAFIVQHGGSLKRLDELTREAAPKQPGEGDR